MLVSCCLLPWLGYFLYNKTQLRQEADKQTCLCTKNWEKGREIYFYLFFGPHGAMHIEGKQEETKEVIRLHRPSAKLVLFNRLQNDERQNQSRQPAY